MKHKSKGTRETTNHLDLLIQFSVSPITEINTCNMYTNYIHITCVRA